MNNKLQLGKFESYTIVNNGLIETELLTIYEKMVYIVIRKHLNQETQKAFPGMATISREARISKKQVIRSIKGLEEKGLLTVKRECTKYNEKKTNIYYFNDFARLWEAKTVSELQEIASETCNTLTDDEIIDKALQIDEQKRKELYEQLAKEVDKEKGLVSAPTKAHSQAPISNNNNSDVNKSTTNAPKSQTERYTMQDLEDLYEYDCLIRRNPDQKTDIDIVFNLLYDTLNTTRPTIRVGGEDKPTMVVIGRLTKLQPDDLLFAIDNYHEQTDRIKNVRGYLLTLLYHARDQSHLDLMNLGHYNGDF